MTATCFNITDLSFAYGGKPVLDKVSMGIDRGMIHGILGPNGSGKTTLLDLIAGHKKPVTGAVRFNGKPVHGIAKYRLARHIALVSQNFYINFPYTVMDVVMMGRYPYMGRFSPPSKTDLQIVEETMRITGVAKYRNHPVTRLSGGERQRTVFARALAQDTDVLLLDEATSNLDINHTLTLLDVVRGRVQKDGMTVIAVFQDINLAAIYCDRMILMKDGQIVAAGPTHDIMDATLLASVFDVESTIRFEPVYGARQAVFKTGLDGA
ncbi:MAG: ABC transporter ATP-binding protein [Thermodesulfobacteriota bacterium]|nr:ABC transporter ATP-binding protein [Thermodesulfobacteriota bacterium]